MLEVCESCKYYDNADTYPGTGYCKLWEEYTEQDSNCPDYEEED